MRELRVKGLSFMVWFMELTVEGFECRLSGLSLGLCSLEVFSLGRGIWGLGRKYAHIKHGVVEV